MIVGLGAESVIETAVALHHTYGVPYIPGRALKGLASSFAHQRLADNAWRKLQGYAHRKIFGTPERAGSITFYDALFIPGTASSGPLHPDIMTPHHTDYYRDGGAPPADWDSPTPISFLSATGGYLLAVGGPEPWRQAAMTLLLEALEEMGVGGKTSSGYGRLGTKEEKSKGPPAGYERGKVKWFSGPTNPNIGYIAPDSGGGDVFVHRSGLRTGLTTIKKGQNVYYRREDAAKGPQAIDVHLADE